jgi:transposase
VEVVRVARQPEVFVQPLEPEQAQRLVKIARTSRDRVRLRRAGIVLASVQGRTAAQIAEMFAASEGCVREVIHAFNDIGFAALDPKWSGGRPRKFGPAARDIICQTARSTASALGQPFTTWSVTKLADYLAEHCRLPVSTETIRRVLRAAGITWQATKTWKTSRDPDFAAKMARILALYDCPPADGRVICVDEFGPLNLLPRPGRGWFRKGQAARQRATYTRTAGVRHMFGALDLASGQLFYRFRDRKRWREFLDFCRQLRRRFPSGRLYLRVRQLRRAPEGGGPHLVRRQRRRAGVHSVERVLAELDRVRVHRAALLHPRRQRLPLPRRPRDRDRPLHPLGQQARQTQAALRRQLQDPQTGLPTQRCVTRH